MFKLIVAVRPEEMPQFEQLLEQTIGCWVAVKRTNCIVYFFNSGITYIVFI